MFIITTSTLVIASLGITALVTISYLLGLLTAKTIKEQQ